MERERWRMRLRKSVRVAGMLLVVVMLAVAAVGCASHARAPVPEPAGTEEQSSPTVDATASPAADENLATAGASTPPGLAPESAPAAPSAARVVYHGSASRRMVALTFDARADTGFAGEILATLRREGVRASFGMTGLWAERNRDLLLAIAADGHQLINHSYDHASFTGVSSEKPPLSAAERALELSRTETTIYHLTQRTTRPYFRPPYGDLDAGVERDAAAAGYGTIVMWSVDSLAWNHASVDAIVARCLAQAAPGAIYIMHVGAESQDAAALPRVIDGLRSAGYSFATIDELLAD